MHLQCGTDFAKFVWLCQQQDVYIRATYYMTSKEVWFQSLNQSKVNTSFHYLGLLTDMWLQLESIDMS